MNQSEIEDKGLPYSEYCHLAKTGYAEDTSANSYKRFPQSLSNFKICTIAKISEF